MVTWLIDSLVDRTVSEELVGFGKSCQLPARLEIAETPTGQRISVSVKVTAQPAGVV